MSAVFDWTRTDERRGRLDLAPGTIGEPDADDPVGIWRSPAPCRHRRRAGFS